MIYCDIHYDRFDTLRGANMRKRTWENELRIKDKNYAIFDQNKVEMWPTFYFEKVEN